MNELVDALIKAAQSRRDILKAIHEQTYNSPSDRHALLIRAQALDDLVMVLMEAQGQLKARAHTQAARAAHQANAQEAKP